MRQRLRILLAFAILLTHATFSVASSAEDRHHASMLSRAETSILGESALLDRETGRVFWEGGMSNTLYESVMPKLNQYGAEHAQATILSALITLAFLGVLAGWARNALDQTGHWIIPSESLPSFVSNGVALLEWAILRVPTIENKYLVWASVALYLLESYNCSTRRFLANAITSTRELEAYIDQLRAEQPVVTWHVLTYHFERRRIFALPFIISNRIRRNRQAKSLGVLLDDIPRSKKCRKMFPFTRKVVSHEDSACYQYGRWEDNTIAGVWRRAESLSTRVAPFTKIALSKILVLSDRKSREDYFKQQAEFVSQTCRDDELVQFSTRIEVPGYRPQLLAVREVEGVPSAKVFRLHLFWLFTLFGMTVPYRIWFKKHSDFLRVSVVKETSASPSGSYSLGATRSFPFSSQATTFKSFMRHQSLYPKEPTQKKHHQTKIPREEDSKNASPGSDTQNSAESAEKK